MCAGAALAICVVVGPDNTAKIDVDSVSGQIPARPGTWKPEPGKQQPRRGRIAAAIRLRLSIRAESAS
jgi:hypothetical protein